MHCSRRPLALLALALLSLALPAQTQAQGTPRPDADPRIQKLVAAVSAERLRAIVAKLESFGTRSTLSDTVSTTRGIGAARRWIHEEFTRSSPKLQVAFDRHPIAQQGRITRDVELVNVVAVPPRTLAASRVHQRPLRHGEPARRDGRGATVHARPAARA
ncbi:MAG: hypothetical protein IPF47_01775 [Gemmatimonadetes bacterium]|nr:hypothetical protein [Gemmatimonadota bacterium]